MYKVTELKCLDGKRHNWTKLEGRIEGVNGAFFIFRPNEIRWCRKCGSITCFRFYPGWIQPYRRVKNENGKYVISFPEFIKDWNKIVDVKNLITSPILPRATYR